MTKIYQCPFCEAEFSQKHGTCPKCRAMFDDCKWIVKTEPDPYAPIDFTNKTREEFEAWACPDGNPRQIHNESWPAGWCILFSGWHTNTNLFHYLNEDGSDGGLINYAESWKIYTEPQQTEPDQPADTETDTSTPEGWEKVVAHALAGGDIQAKINGSDKWINLEKCSGHHPKYWFNGDFTYRIKPARIPKVDEVWTDKGNVSVAILSEHDGAFVGMYWDKDRYELGDYMAHEFVEFLGVFDLSLLQSEGENDAIK